MSEINVRPSKMLGQNFLVDSNVLAIVIDVIDPGPDDHILEIGPGLGALTEPMARTARRVVSVEKDRRLYAWLKRRLGQYSNVELLCGDMLGMDYEAISPPGLKKVVSNLPYSVGSAMLVNFLQAAHPPEQMILTMQLEVGKRLAADTGQAGFGLLSLWSGLSYDASIRKVVSPHCFYPAPKVRSAVVHLVRRVRYEATPPEKKMFFQLTKYAFSQRRKQLKTLFGNPPKSLPFSGHQALGAFQASGIDTTMRPDVLTALQWREVASRMISR